MNQYVTNKEQCVVCIRWIDESLTDYEYFIGVDNVGITDANTPIAEIHDVLLHMSMTMAQCRGQCYNRASNMSRNKHSVTAQRLAEEPRALLTHCYYHVLNLAVANAIKHSRGVG